MPVSPLTQAMSLSAVPSTSSKPVPFSTPMKGGEIISVPSSVARRGSPTPMTEGGTMSVLPSAVQRGVMAGGSTFSVLPSAVRRGVPMPMTVGSSMPVQSIVRLGGPIPMTGEGTVSAPPSAVQRGGKTGGSTKPVLPSAVRRSAPTPMTGGGTMSVPSSVIRRGSPTQTALPSVIKFNRYGELSELLCYSPHAVLYEDKVYPTALHLFEARKFLSHLPDLADRIRQCEHVEQVTSISAEMADFIRRDWGNVMLNMVSKSSISHTRMFFD